MLRREEEKEVKAIEKYSIRSLVEAIKQGDLKEIDKELEKDPTIFSAIIEKENNIVFKHLAEKGVNLHGKTCTGISVPEYVGLCSSWSQADKREAYSIMSKKGVQLARSHELAIFGNVRELKEMIDRDKASFLEQKDGQGNNIFHYAAANGQIEVLEMLNTEYPGMLSTENGVGLTPLLLAAYNGQIRTMEWLLSKGASLSEVDKYGNSPHHLAAYNGKTDAFKWLFEKKPLMGKDKRGYTPFLYAAFSGSHDIMQLLIERDSKAVLSEKDNEGHSAVMLAAKNGRHQTVKLLVKEHKVSLAEKNKAGENAHALATRNGHREVAKFIASEIAGASASLSSSPSSFIRRIGGEGSAASEPQSHLPSAAAFDRARTPSPSSR